MFRAIPTDTLETNRLLLRIPTSSDAQVIYEAVMETIPELRPWMPWVQHGYALEDAESFISIAQNGYEADETLSCSLFRKSDGLLIGSVGLHDVNWQVPRFEIGYWLRTSATGHGYMTEAVIHLTQLCRDRFAVRRMTIRCDSQNSRSRQVAERSGYQFESLTKNDRRSPLDNSLRDMLTFTQIWPD